MFRLATIIVLLLAYSAAANHCALTEFLCAGDCETTAGCTHHEAAAHGNCLLEKPQPPAPAGFSLAKIIGSLVAILPAFLLWQCIHFLITKNLFKPPVRPQPPDDWLGLIRRRHFILRAAGFARAP